MTGQFYQSLWTTVRDDDTDSYQILDPADRIIASVPTGTTNQDIDRQRYARDLIVAAPALLFAAQRALAELDGATPNVEVARSLLGQAISAARGKQP